jgi:hypothetical protein
MFILLDIIVTLILIDIVGSAIAAIVRKVC